MVDDDSPSVIDSVPRQKIPIRILVTSCHTMEFRDSEGGGGGGGGGGELKTAKRGVA